MTNKYEDFRKQQEEEIIKFITENRKSSAIPEDLIKKHDAELKAAMQNHDFAVCAFKCELANDEYTTYGFAPIFDDSGYELTNNEYLPRGFAPIFDALGYEEEEILSDPLLKKALEEAKELYLRELAQVNYNSYGDGFGDGNGFGDGEGYGSGNYPTVIY